MDNVGIVVESLDTARFCPSEKRGSHRTQLAWMSRMEDQRIAAGGQNAMTIAPHRACNWNPYSHIKQTVHINDQIAPERSASRSDTFAFQPGKYFRVSKAFPARSTSATTEILVFSTICLTASCSSGLKSGGHPSLLCLRQVGR